MRRAPHQAVRELTPRVRPQVHSITDRLEHRDEPGAPPWVGAAVDNSPRPFWEPPIEAAAPVAPPIDPSSTPEFHRMMLDARRFAEVAGMRAAQEQIDALRDRYLDSIATLERSTREAARPHGHEIVSIAMIVAKEIIGRELAVDRGLLTARLDDAMERAGNEAPVRVRMATADLAFLGAARQDLIDSGVIFVDDPEINQGGCVVETSQRVVDATIETRLAAARQAVLAVLDGSSGPDHPFSAEAA